VSTTERSSAGSAIVIYGMADGFVNLDLASSSIADDFSGYLMQGAVSYDTLGSCVSGAGMYAICCICCCCCLCCIKPNPYIRHLPIKPTLYTYHSTYLTHMIYIYTHLPIKTNR
jgi:hypothetical protein